MDNIKYIDLATVKENRRTESALCVISGEKFVKESVPTALVSKTPVALFVGSTNGDRRVVESPLVKDENKISTYRIQSTNEDVSFYQQVESNTLSPKINGTGRKGSEVSALEQGRTSYIVYNTEGRFSSKGLHNICNGIRNLQSKS